MTTEDDFQAALDANPEDWQTRLVFADWLEEQGDPRAEGYRALGFCLFVPMIAPEKDGVPTQAWWHRGKPREAPRIYIPTNTLPADLFDALGAGGANGMWPSPGTLAQSRRAAEDAAALAFAKLPPARRAELLNGKVATV